MATPEGLWAITSYFNPMRYRRRLSNFRLFRKHLNIPLLVVELAYGEEFELHEQDAEVLIQLRGGAVLWQKERLLNVALSALPESCLRLAWLDCDIILGNAEWAHIANSLLDRFSIIQLFKRVHFLSPQWTPGENPASHVEFTRPSLAFSLVSGVPAAECIGHLFDGPIATPGFASAVAPGIAWAARRELLKQHGFFDACILGNGDCAIICAAARCFGEFMARYYMNEQQQLWYLGWAVPFSESMQTENIGFLDADIFHLWHGDIRHRAYRARYEGLQPFQFDPFTDIRKDHDGPWRWSTDKPQMHKYVATYFASRREDG
jgi:hypothetical protein